MMTIDVRYNDTKERLSLEQLNGAILTYETKEGETIVVKFGE